MWRSNRSRAAALALAVLIAGCGSTTTKTVTVAKAPPVSTSSTAATGPTGALGTGASGATGPPLVAAADADTLLAELQTAWDDDNSGAGLDSILTFNVIFDYQNGSFRPVTGFTAVRKLILALLNSNGQGNKLALSGVTLGTDGLGTYATGTWVSPNVKAETGTFQIRFAPPAKSPFKNDPCATAPCIQQITLVPTPAPVQGQG